MNKKKSDNFCLNFFLNFFQNFFKKDLFFCCILSFVLVGIFNDYEFKNISFFYGFLALLLIFLFTNSLLVLLSFSHKILKISLIILLFFSTINLYVQNKYGYILDEIMIANALDSIGHIDDAIDYNLFLYFGFLTIIPAIILCILKLKKTSYKNKLFAMIFDLIIALTLFISLPKTVVNFAINTISPSSFIASSYRYYQRFSSASIIAKNRQSLTNFYNFNYVDKIKDNKNELKIIVVIGESLRSDHLQLFGYNRLTTPNLAMRKNLLKFRSQAFYQVTTPAINDLLSSRLNSEFMDIPKEKSLVDLMKNLDFKTYWFSMQSSKQFGTEMLNIMAMESDEYFFRDRIRMYFPNRTNLYDADLLPYLNQVIQKNQRSFIVLHTFGSHTHFFERYPQQFKVYRDECGKDLQSCSLEQINNSYDNSVLYTDYFLDETIKIIDQSNAILFFISDHGSFLGENGIYANGNLSDVGNAAHNVPMFIYFSKKLQENIYYRNKMIVASKNQQKIINPDYFFDSVLDCSSIKSTLLDTRKLSLCSN